MLAQFHSLHCVDIEHSLKERFLEGVIFEGRLIDAQQLSK